MDDSDLKVHISNIVRGILDEGWRDHDGVRGNMAYVLEHHYADGLPIDDLVKKWKGGKYNHPGPLAGVKRIAHEIDAVSEPGTAFRNELVALAVRLLTPGAPAN